MPDQYLPNPLYIKQANEVTFHARQRSQVVRQQIEQKNRALQQQNERIAEVLRKATRANLDSDPRRWWQWWQAYVDENPDRRAATIQNGLSGSLLQLPTSGLPAGTLVWTQTGRRRIEELLIGDLVLAQDSKSGELSYKAVRGVSVAETPLRRIDFRDHAFLSAPGLALWQVDQGWWLARDLNKESLVHGLSGPVRVTGTAESIRAPVYHLAIADFSNFFISDKGILVHDVTLLQPVAERVPGLSAKLADSK